ncbi:hypothetical protein llap_7068 [Limosa lapponica baueri]|uniref:Uncharacterized protein n=1 Tax=Limosa lapponica baueri TaxID=1758121 RepID=A0A2I0U971_LIMLA|nr:hypothetical protein llap_7068 [Limosa lapponica baueri]
MEQVAVGGLKPPSSAHCTSHQLLLHPCGLPLPCPLSLLGPILTQGKVVVVAAEAASQRRLLEEIPVHRTDLKLGCSAESKELEQQLLNELEFTAAELNPAAFLPGRCPWRREGSMALRIRDP